MGASVIDSIERALHIKESNLLVTNFDHLPLIGNNLISFRYLHKTCYNSPSIKFLLERLNFHSIRLTFSLPGIHGVIKRGLLLAFRQWGSIFRVQPAAFFLSILPFTNRTRKPGWGEPVRAMMRNQRCDLPAGRPAGSGYPAEVSFAKIRQNYKTGKRLRH